MQYNPIALTDSYGAVDKYFGDLLKSLGYSGNVLGANQSFFSANPEDMGSMSATAIDPAFQKWAQANGISTSMGKGDDYNIMQLLQNGNVVGEKKYTTKDGLDKFAEVAGPIALAIGTGGVLGQALGFINPAMNPLDPSTWGGASGAGGVKTLPPQAVPPITPAVAETLPMVGAAGGAAAAGAAGAASGGIGSTLSTAAGGLLNFVKENPKLSGALLGGLLGGSGGGSGGGYSYNGPMPTISRQGWSPTAQANLMPTQSVVQGLPQAQGQQYSGLLRYLGG